MKTDDIMIYHKISYHINEKLYGGFSARCPIFKQKYQLINNL
jgi:hypothetical protein